MDGENKQSIFIAVLLAVFFALILAPFIYLPVIGGSSEAREAHIVQIIFNGGDWILPLRNGFVPSKPPMFHWFGAILSLGLGEANEFSARLTSLLSAAILLGFTVFFASQLARRGPALVRERSNTVSFLAGVIVSTTYGFTSMGLLAQVDMLCALFMSIAIMLLLNCMAEDRLSPTKAIPIRTVLLAALLCGLAIITKGPLGIALPVFVVSCACIYREGFRRAVPLLVRFCPAIIFMSLIVAGPWIIAATLHGQDAFIERQFLFENVRRLVGGENVNSAEWWFYLPSFMQKTFPWGVIFTYLLALSSRQALSHNQFLRTKNLYAIWVFAGLLLFSVASGKRHSYLLPIFPGMSIYLAVSLTEAFFSLRAATRARWELGLGLLYSVALGFLVALILANGALVFIGSSVTATLTPMQQEILWWLKSQVWNIEIILLLTFFINAVLIWRAQRSKHYLWCGAWLTVLTLIVSAMGIGSGIKNHLKSFPEMAQAVNIQAGSSKIKAFRTREDELFDPLFYYLKRPVEIVAPVSENVVCSTNEDYVMLARASFFIGIPAEKRELLVELGRFDQRGDRITGRKDRQAVLFQCARTG